MNTKTFTMDELCGLTGYPKRKIRYYIQHHLVSSPIGEKRAARYTEEHLGQLLKIKELTADGVSLERIREVLHGEKPPVPPRGPKPGTVEVRSHIYVAPGVEIQVAPEEAGLSPEELRAFVAEIMKVAEKMLHGPNSAS